jgi:hypothetical protein
MPQRRGFTVRLLHKLFVLYILIARAFAELRPVPGGQKQFLMNRRDFRGTFQAWPAQGEVWSC